VTTQSHRFNPFPGLRPFYSHEKHLFFGREAQTQALLQRLRAERFLAAVGPSGSGKSSLVRAGLIPSLYGGSLSRAGSHWNVITFRPGGDPLSSLAEAISRSPLYPEEIEDLRLHLRTTLARSALGLLRTVEQSRLAGSANLMVVIDQFEELFRFTGHQRERRGEAEAFVNLLLEASRQSIRPIYVVLTMRSDFLGECARFDGLAETVNRGQYLIPRLNHDQWRLAIEGPVRVGGGAIAPRLVQRLLADVADDPDQLPILQHALMRTWDHWVARTSNGQRIDLPHYDAIGGMQEALSRHADEVYDSLPNQRHRHIAELVFRALTEKTADHLGVRRPASLRVLASVTRGSDAELNRVIDAFRDPGRTFLMPAAPEPLNAETVIDISHESLMRVWRRMRDWVEREAQAARIYRRLLETARLWEAGEAGLYRDPDLALALAWQNENHPHQAWAEHYRPGFALAMKFLEASRLAEETAQAERELARRRALEQAQSLAEAERRRAEDRTRAAHRLGLAAIALLALALATGWAAWKATREQRRASAREVAAEAQARLSVDPLASLELVFTKGVSPARTRWGGGVDPVLQDALRESLFASRSRHVLLGHTGAIWKLAIAPQTSWLATAGDDGTVRVWRTDTGIEQYCLTNHLGSSLASILFRPDGRQLLSVDFRPRAHVWEPHTGRLLHTLPNRSPSARVTSVDWAPDGRTIALGGEDGLVWLWEPSTERLEAVVQHTSKTLVAFSGAGHYLASGDQAGSVKILEVASRTLVAQWQAHEGGVTYLGFSPDPARPELATADSDGSAKLWNLRGDPIAAHRQGAGIERIAFSPSGDLLVSASHDGTAHVWGRDGQRPKVLSGHQGAVVDASFSPDSRYVVTAGHDGTGRLWSADSTGEPATLLLGHRGQLNGAGFLDNGTNVVTISSDGTARIWESPIASTTRLHGYEQGQRARTAAFAQAASLLLVRNLRNEAALYTSLDDPVPRPLITTNDVQAFRVSSDQTLALLQFTTATNLHLWALGHHQPPPELPFGGSIEHTVFIPGSPGLLTATPQAALQRWILPPNHIPSALGEPLRLPGITNIQELFQGGDGSFVVLKAALNSGTVQLEVRDLRGGQRLAAFPASGTVLDELRIAIAPHPPLTILVGNADGEVFIWDWSRPGIPLRAMKAHRDKVLAVGFDPSATFGFSASSDTTVAVWSIPTGRLIARLNGHSRFVLAAAFAHDSASVLSLGNDGQLIRFSLPECLPWDRVTAIASERLGLSP
jgi:WD40 repeat protein/energy-coupling factor transporter ATP-binding protein EcfA2